MKFLGKDHPFELSRWDSFVVDEETLQSNVPGVFCGGDAVTGPDTVINAMAQGKLAAESIAQYLTTGVVKRVYNVATPHRFVEPLPVSEDDGQLQPAVMPELDPKERISMPDAEVELGFTQEMAIAEARRCLRCDLKK
jgi:NADH-quinone oxidoreductase subunit F